MKDLATLLERSQTYERSYAEFAATGIRLQAEREGIIALGKSLGFFASRLNAELPKVPNLRGGAEELPPPAAAPDLPTVYPAIGAPWISPPPAMARADLSAMAAEVNYLFEGMPAWPGVQPDDKLCQDMTDDEICLGHMDIVRRCASHAGGFDPQDSEWLFARKGAFEAQLTARGLTPLPLGGQDEGAKITINKAAE